MKLHRLELEGFGPFRDAQSVDFDAFDADGLFLIAGRTGAGKSSILDGVCYALYGTAPRYDGSDRGLRSDHAAPADPTVVRLEFTTAGARWRITRTPEYERPKARGEGTTTQKSTVLLERLVGDAWHARATKYREVADELQEILGLTRDQFQQVILLAQNRFAQFLLAGNDERQALLRTLFGSRRYEEYEKAFDARRRDGQQELDGQRALRDAHVASAEAIVDRGGLATPAGDSADVDDEGADVPAEPAASGATRATAHHRLDALDRAVPRARYRAEQSALRRDRARAAHDDALTAYAARAELRRRQQERADARAALAELEAAAPRIADVRDLAARARAAETLRAPVDASSRAADAARRLGRHRDEARAEWVALGEDDVPPAELRARVERIAGDLGAWARASDSESALPALAAGLERLDAQIAESDERLTAEKASTAVRAARRAEIQPLLADARVRAAAADSARVAADSARERLDAAREAARREPAAHEAEAAHLAAATAHERASAAVRALLQQRIADRAGDLAASLDDGKPCAVCGSREHPDPAPPSADPVTDAMLEAAEAEVAAAARALDVASERARATAAAYQAARARAGDMAPEALEDACAAADEAVEAAQAAAERAALLAREFEDLRDADDAHEARIAALSEDVATARQERAVAEESLRTAREAVDAARGDHPSVADRIAHASRRRDVARALADAAEACAHAEATSADADEALTSLLAATDFGTAEEVRAALRTPTELGALDAEVRTHDIALAGEKERLLALETELAGEPDELVDLEAAAAVVSAARADLDVALEDATRDVQLVAQLEDAVDRAHAAHDSVASRLEEMEVIAGLADAITGRSATRMDLETFVLAAELEQIVAAANLRLDAMSSGRYRLLHSDAVGRRRVASGLGLEVLDAYTGQARAPQSLSGGETFLASLALALGLAEVVTARAGGVRLDTLFIDEGFGSLDPETLDLAMRTLDELRQGGRTVGLISHVEAMKEQLPAQLRVEATPQGPSVIRQDAAIPA